MKEFKEWHNFNRFKRRMAWIKTPEQTEMRLSMSRFIKSIPVDEDLPPSSLICQTWAEK